MTLTWSDMFALVIATTLGLAGYKIYAVYSESAPAADNRAGEVPPAPGAEPQNQATASTSVSPPNPPPRSGEQEKPPISPPVVPPQPPPQPDMPRPDGVAGVPKFRIVLPPAIVLSDSIMDVPSDWQSSNLPHTSQVYIWPYPDGATHGIFATSDGRCHGASAALYPNGELCTLAYYRQGQLHGTLRLWAADRERLLYAEYANGQRHGPLCLFDHDYPCFVQKWKYGKVEEEYLVEQNGDEAMTIRRSEIEPESDAGRQLDKCRQKLDDTLGEIETNERNIKQNIANWYRKESERIKRERAASQSAAKREAITSRIESRNAVKRGNWEWQLQRALSRQY